MAYQIDRYNRTLLTTVEDGTLDQTTDLRFIGKNYAGYGEIHNENFLFLLENFANANPPPKALNGQVWFDSGQNKLKFYDGSKWRATGGSETTPTPPVGLSVGDFWWDTSNDQLFVYNGIEFILIGPQNAGENLTQMISQELLDINGANRAVIVSFVDGNPVSIFSPVDFEIDPIENISQQGYTRISRGITLRDSTNGVTTSTYRFKGTATNADKFNNRILDDFILKENPDFLNQITTGISGMLIANDFGLSAEIGSPGPLRGVISNTSGADNEIHFKTNNGTNNTVHSISISSKGIMPSADNQFDLGSDTLRFKNVYAESFSGGPATRANSLKISNGVYLSASTAATPDTIAARDANADIYANEFNGTATSARYADLAEKYTTDKEYPVGTVLAVSSNPQSETSEVIAGDTAIGVVSEFPAYLMNSESEGQPIALKGRVPVRVIGKVSKGEKVYVYDNGMASAEVSDSLVGIALEASVNDKENLIECVLKV